MTETKYTYTPDIPEVFRCRVPLPGTLQAFVNNGALRENLVNDRFTLKSQGAAGIEFNVAPACIVDDTIQVISFRDSSDTSDINFISNITFGRESSSSTLLCTHTLSLDKFKTDEVINIKAEQGSRSHIVIMQNEHNESAHKFQINISVEEGAFLRINFITLHGALLENEVVVNLNGKGASCELNGAYLMDGSQIIKTNIMMNHLEPECYSSQLFKGILDDSAKAYFSGRIVVAKDAQKTQAYQANHNLLISPAAKAYAQPQLEIYADDVKCSHGATSGRLDEMGLFYMRSRGISGTEAKLLQQLAFVYDVLEKIENQHLRDRLHDLVESRLRGEFGHCTNCSMNCC
ncbi:MAG: SufD family Fe-S cluster assembly protein [Bacteroidales bacterium]|nr:SufD family Fe-S cluster assembly protein [Bacteroidales bacterium]